MIPNKAGDGPGASGGVHLDLCIAETKDSPTLGSSFSIECVIPRDLLGMCPPVMPIAAIGLHNELGILKDEVRLPPTKHSLVHLESETSLLELAIQHDFNVRELKTLAQSDLALPLAGFRRLVKFLQLCSVRCGKGSAKKRLALSLPSLKGDRVAKKGLATLLARFRGCFATKLGPAYLRPPLRRERATPDSLAQVLSVFSRKSPTPKRLTEVLSVLRRKWTATTGLAEMLPVFCRERFTFRPSHFMFNYNTALGALA